MPPILLPRVSDVYGLVHVHISVHNLSDLHFLPINACSNEEERQIRDPVFCSANLNCCLFSCAFSRFPSKYSQKIPDPFASPWLSFLCKWEVMGRTTYVQHTRTKLLISLSFGMPCRNLDSVCYTFFPTSKIALLFLCLDKLGSMYPPT